MLIQEKHSQARSKGLYIVVPVANRMDTVKKETVEKSVKLDRVDLAPGNSKRWSFYCFSRNADHAGINSSRQVSAIVFTWILRYSPKAKGRTNRRSSRGDGVEVFFRALIF